MPKVQRIWQTAAIMWQPPLVRSRYVVGLHCVSPFHMLESEASLSCTMLKHCHRTTAGAVTNTVGLKARAQSNFVGQQGKTLKRKEGKKDNKHSRLFSSI